MFKRFSILAGLLVACSAQQCSINLGGNTDSGLNSADANFVISRDATDSLAAVTADITDGFSDVILTEDQSVTVNDESLERHSGEYRVSVDAADVYTIAVVDPRRGTDKTDVAEPGPFGISSPADGDDASLSGFTITWNHPDSALEVEIELMQDLLDDHLTLSLGRMDDTGSADVTAHEMAEAGFGQGAPMTITLTKLRTVTNLHGFADGRAECRVSVSVDVNPAP